jgi:hypothetical protein
MNLKGAVAKLLAGSYLYFWQQHLFAFYMQYL